MLMMPFIRTSSHDNFTPCSYGLPALQASSGRVTRAATRSLHRTRHCGADAQCYCESAPNKATATGASSLIENFRRSVPFAPELSTWPAGRLLRAQVRKQQHIANGRRVSK